MADWKGFISYVHDDDKADGGRICRLAKDIKDQYQMLTGETIALFLDKDAIMWGEEWRDKIDLSLASVAYFIPVLTPRYFMRPECRRELQYYARKATESGTKEIILPLYYVSIPSIENNVNQDDLVKLVCTFQMEDWRESRFLDTSSEGYRKGVARLAARLVEANRRAEETTAIILPRADEASKEEIDEAPGMIDKLAVFEEKLNRWPETMGAMTRIIEIIGKIMRSSTEDLEKADKQNAGFGARLIIVRRTAQQLAEPSKNIWVLSNEFVSLVHGVDEGIRIIIERAPFEIANDPDAKMKVCEFFNSVRKLVISSQDALDSTQIMIDQIKPLESVSRDLRPVIRTLRQGLTIMLELKEVIGEWAQLIDSSVVGCDS